MKKICAIGSVTTDIILSTVDHLPQAGTLQKVERSSVHVGGCASNAAIDLAKLGVPVLLCCKVGTDSFGDFVINSCREAGVDPAGILRDSHVSTTTSIVCVNSQGERSFLYNPGSTSALRAEEIPEELLDSCDILFVGGAMLLTEFDGAPCGDLLRKMQKKGKFTVMDTAWDFDGIWLPKLKEALEGLDLFMPSYDEAAMLTGEEEISRIADRLFDYGVRRVIIKNGSEGAYLAPNRQTRLNLPAYHGIPVVDTTGAGDSFCAGFLCGLAQGWDFERCGWFANAVGAHCIQAVGASTGIPGMETVLEFMRKNS
jgi:sugar/nucleoside kinase (ribokinase family)